MMNWKELQAAFDEIRLSDHDRAAKIFRERFGINFDTHMVVISGELEHLLGFDLGRGSLREADVVATDFISGSSFYVMERPRLQAV